MSGKCAFTLLELLVVMLIIAILIGIGAAGFSMARQTAKESRARADIELIRNALEEYRVEYGSYPNSESGALTAVAGELSVYADIQTLDPWGRAYGYVSTNRFEYRIWSEGVDENNPDDNVDPSEVGY
ncbi:type II secretion system protein [Pontiella sp.]|uniref:type II secretion system protein n=1 Tax=Pontiella sp. TaxID=2837462 RepID=UPI00356A272F